MLQHEHRLIAELKSQLQGKGEIREEKGISVRGKGPDLLWNKLAESNKARDAAHARAAALESQLGLETERRRQNQQALLKLRSKVMPSPSPSMI